MVWHCAGCFPDHRTTKVARITFRSLLNGIHVEPDFPACKFPVLRNKRLQSKSCSGFHWIHNPPAVRLPGSGVSPICPLLPSRSGLISGWGSRNFHVVISVDTKNIFNHVARTLHVYTIRRNLQRKTFGRFFHSDFHFQAGYDALHRFCRNFLSNQWVYIIIESSTAKSAIGFG